MAQRIVFYSHNGFGLGHVRRNYLLARALKDADSSLEILLITGSPFPLEPALSERIDYVRLPSLLRIDSNEWAPKQFPAIDALEVCRLRSAIILSVVQSFRPDVFVADHIPQGVYGELLPSLEWLTTRGRPSVAGFRDILDTPEKVRSHWATDRTLKVLETHYARVLIYGSQDVFDFRLYGLDDLASPPPVYCGYLGRPEPPKGAVDIAGMELRGGRPRSILACTGGGADGLQVLKACVQAGPDLQERLQARMVAVAGPLMPSRDWETLESVAGPLGIELRGRIETFTAYVAAADLFIGMCGYNTVCETLSYGVPLVSIPRTKPSGEQRLRAQAFARLGLLTHVDQRNLNRDSLLAAATAAIGNGRPKRLPFSMDGGAAARDEILSLL